MATPLNKEVKAALHSVLWNPLLENARALEAALGAVFQTRVFGRLIRRLQSKPHRKAIAA
jgi:hypothetical protein